VVVVERSVMCLYWAFWYFLGLAEGFARVAKIWPFLLWEDQRLLDGTGCTSRGALWDAQLYTLL
jgi:hypothetical protein